MSWFRSVGVVVALVVLVVSVGCGSSSSSSSSTTAPSATTYTDTFSGNVATGGSNKDSNKFTVHQAGNISATITKLSPLSTITIGLGLGVYDNTNNVCNLQLFADNAKLNQVLAASVSVAGDLCVGVYDVGNIVDSVDFEVSVTHT